MASIVKTATLNVSAETAWAGLRDVGNVHRVFRGVLTDCQMQGDCRVVTFNDGQVIRERIISVDDVHRRYAYTVLLEGLVHHHASMQIVPDGNTSRFVWITDILPAELAVRFNTTMEAGAEALRRSFDDRAAGM